MHRPLHSTVVAFALLISAPSLAMAQQQVIPEAIDAASPRAVRARAVAELVLAGDQAALEVYLREHAAPSLRADTALSSQLRGVSAAVREGAREILRLDGLPNGAVAVVLARGADASPERAIVVGLEPEPPHRVTRVRLIRLTMGGFP